MKPYIIKHSTSILIVHGARQPRLSSETKLLKQNSQEYGTLPWITLSIVQFSLSYKYNVRIPIRMLEVQGEKRRCKIIKRK